ncbi:lasso peptide biosynthesis PqqD family chaperone [Bacillus alkalicellulosilyticus]|uniref:lasso peptide biosynthesis PqqD family chaperone n=1 Tax=Alkalihalobacterium alkalicellulosilyticum TaxID=1912214 RepID=UPI000996BD70|nr:lasso peptide biosynthesis PqqD family chaperone [Bacillus alkalicellulosilyticus]
MSVKQLISIDAAVVQGQGNIVSDMDGEKVMLSIHNGKYYNLGELGGEIWELIGKETLVSEVIASLLNSYEVDKETCEEQVISFLQMLHQEGLIQIV